MMMSKSFGWLMVGLNLVLLGLLATMHEMAAMWLMGGIMLIDAVNGLVNAYRAHPAHQFH